MTSAGAPPVRIAAGDIEVIDTRSGRPPRANLLRVQPSPQYPAIELLIAPRFPDQWRIPANPAAAYPIWLEGSCRVTGTVGNDAVEGNAFMELAGARVGMVLPRLFTDFSRLL